jgi:hypothetical protein
VLACAERHGATDVQVFFETAVPVDPDNFDEEAMRQMFLSLRDDDQDRSGAPLFSAGQIGYQ